MIARLADIITASAMVFYIRRDDLTGNRRYKWFVEPRKAAYLAAHREGHAYSAIARAFDRDHSTVISGCDSARYRAERDEEYTALIDRARQIARTRRFIVPPRLVPPPPPPLHPGVELDAIETADARELEHMARGSARLLEALRCAVC